MRIDQLTVKNFRCFADQTFTFDPQFNVLVGENGSGKTAIIEALATSLQYLPFSATKRLTLSDALITSNKKGEQIRSIDDFDFDLTTLLEIAKSDKIEEIKYYTELPLLKEKLVGDKFKSITL